MVPIIRHVVAAKGQHGHGIPAHGDALFRRRGGFGSHGGGQIDAMRPIEGLEDQGHMFAHAAPEDEGLYGHALGIIPFRIIGGTLGNGRGKPGVGVGGEAAAIRGPILSPPVDEVSRGFLGHPFPPDVVIVGKSHVGENAVFGQG